MVQFCGFNSAIPRHPPPSSLVLLLNLSLRTIDADGCVFFFSQHAFSWPLDSFVLPLPLFYFVYSKQPAGCPYRSTSAMDTEMR